MRGMCTRKIRGNSVSVKFDLEGKLCDVFCLREAGGKIWTAICTPDADKDDACDGCEILERTTVAVRRNVRLPDAFLEYLKGEREVVVIGLHDRIEIMSKDHFEADESSEKTQELCRELIDLLDGKDI